MSYESVLNIFLVIAVLAGVAVIYRLYTRWRQSSRLELKDSDLSVYQLDRDSGTIEFGDGINGARPDSSDSSEHVYESGGGVAGDSESKMIIVERLEQADDDGSYEVEQVGNDEFLDDASK